MDAIDVLDQLARRKPAPRDIHGHFVSGSIGHRQREILELLAEGGWSVEALMHRLGVENREERQAVLASVYGLSARGFVQILGRRHAGTGFAGVMVELAAVASS